MDWDRLTQTAPPASAPVTLAEAKAQLRVDGAAEDAYIGDLIDRATALIDGPDGIGICVVTQSWRLTLDGFSARIRVPLGPVMSVDAIGYVDSDGVAQTMPASGYRVLIAGKVALIEPAYGQSWPTAQKILGSVTVDFTAGYATVPTDLKHMILLLVSHWFENRVPMGEEAMSDMPYGIEAMMSRYRAGTVA